MSGGTDNIRRAIILSLFSPAQPGQSPNETYIAHVQTFEGQAGTPDRKARFLLLSVTREGPLKLHKSKQNSNGTFSIGKTWSVDDLQGVEVHQRLQPGAQRSEGLAFTLIINQKQYTYETEPPSSGQASFLVTLVRCWRRYMQGRNRPDLNLVGFLVDSPTPPSSARAAPSHQQYDTPPLSSQSFSQSMPARPPSTASHRTQGREMAPPPRPGTAMSSRSDRTGRADPVSPPPTLARPGGGQGQGPPPGMGRRPSAVAIPQQPPAQLQSPPLMPMASTSSMTAPIERERTPPVARQPMRDDDTPPPRSAARQQQRDQQQASTSSARSAQATPAAAAVTSPPTATANGAASTVKSKALTEDLVDGDTVLANVEEMLEGFEWRGGGGGGSSWGAGGGQGGVKGVMGKADEIEKRLVGELKALEAASIHAILESDDRVNYVIQHLDEALADLDKLDQMVGLYKTQLSLVSDDIAHIESQNRGLQVQTSNQRALLAELDNLLETVQIPQGVLTALVQESLESPKGIERLEKAAVSLYKALLSTRDAAVGDLAVASENANEYRQKASQFGKRLFDYLAIVFKYQIEQLQAKSNGESLPTHSPMEDFLGRYCGLMLFVREIDHPRYQQICAAYFTAISDLYRREIQDLMSTLRNNIKKPGEDDLEATFSNAGLSPTIRQGTMKRAGTVMRGPTGGKERDASGKVMASDAFKQAIRLIIPHVMREQQFLADFLHITPVDELITFADYMTLEAFFRRGASAHLQAQLAKGSIKDIRGAMSVVFGWLDAEIRDWVDGVTGRDNMQIIGIMAALDRAMVQAEKERNTFLTSLFLKQHQRSVTVLERATKDQIKAIEQTKLTLKKRKGVVPFIRVFPLFVTRIESQLENADDLPIRSTINQIYDRLVGTMMDCLQQMAKMDGEGHGEDKDQLNYHVILIENMHYITLELTKQMVPALGPFVDQAQDKYRENLDQYIKLVLRRPLARLLDYFQGLEQLLRSTPPNEVSLHSAFTRSALRRATSSLNAKDLRKAIDTLYKRVDKHFGDATSPSAEHVLIIKTVWKACEDEVLRLTRVWKGLIDRCYGDDAKASLEFTESDVQADFKRAQMS